ncbi:hypothetical protein HM1_1031 [Heliomicrobium modesticaldum Ice1]|uniref:Uncharacterized protein n=1 Tax=Heliobacterium modesticaldum (strain ATCC 51547 / Ice1) TaxID=498761 RepID=B0TIC3_HELMI|nr:hypothetical protein HM1_1031 [Heliomicrobium modesticaldum Ice1]
MDAAAGEPTAVERIEAEGHLPGAAVRKNDEKHHGGRR